MIMCYFAHVGGYALKRDGSELVDQEHIDHVPERDSMSFSALLIESCPFPVAHHHFCRQPYRTRASTFD